MNLVQQTRLAIGYDPRSVVEFGCGDGKRLQAWRSIAADRAVGIDQTGEQWRVETLERQPCLGIGADHVFGDPTEPRELGERFELAMALGVAERIEVPSAHAGKFADTLCASSDRVVFGCPPEALEFWSRLFRSRGYLGQNILRHRLTEPEGALVVFSRADRMVMLPSFEILIPSGDGTQERELTIAVSQIAGLTGARAQSVDHQACVDKARCELAERFLRGGAAEFAVFIDADQKTTAQEVYDLLVAAHMSKREVLAGFVARKTLPSNHAHGDALDGSKLVVGEMGPQQQTRQAGFGMVAVHRNAFRRIAAWSRRHPMHPWAVSATSLGVGKQARDFFRPVLGSPNPGRKCLRTGAWVRDYMGEDSSFCARHVAAGGAIWVTPAIWPGHVGRFTFGREHLCE